MDPAQFDQRLLGLGDLAFEMRDLLDAFLRRQLQAVLGRAAGLRVDHLADFGQREAEFLALEDEREPVAVGTAEEPPPTVTSGVEQAAALVETKGAVGQREFIAEIVDGEFALVASRRGFAAGAVDPEDVMGRGRVRGVARVHGVAFRDIMGEKPVRADIRCFVIDVGANGEKFAVKRL